MAILPYNIQASCWGGCPSPPAYALHTFSPPCICITGTVAGASASADTKTPPQTDGAAGEPSRK